MIRYLPPFLLVPCVALPLAPGAPAQREPEPALLLEAGDHPIEALLQRSAEVLGRNYLYSDTDLQHVSGTTVRLQNPMRLARDEIAPVVSQLLYAKGLVMVPLHPERGLYEWIAVAGPKRMLLQMQAHAWPPERVLENRRLVVPVRTAVPLRHIDAQLAQNQLRPFFSTPPGATLSLSIGATGRNLLLSGLAPDVAGAIELLHTVDTAAGDEYRRTEQWQRRIEDRLKELESRIEGRAEGEGRARARG